MQQRWLSHMRYTWSYHAAPLRGVVMQSLSTSAWEVLNPSSVHLYIICVNVCVCGEGGGWAGRGRVLY